MNPNHFLAVAIGYLFGGARPGWPRTPRIGKTLVSSSMIDRVAAVARQAAGRGAGRVQVVRARAARRVGRLRRRGVGGRVVPARATARPGPPTRTASCWPCWPRRSWRRPGGRRASTTPTSSRSTAIRRTPGSTRRPTREQKAKLGRAVAGGRDGDRAGRRADHRQADRGARQRRRDRRAQGRPPSRPGSRPGRPAPRTSTRSTPSRSSGPEHLAQVQAEARDVVSAALG